MRCCSLLNGTGSTKQVQKHGTYPIFSKASSTSCGELSQMLHQLRLNKLNVIAYANCCVAGIWVICPFMVNEITSKRRAQKENCCGTQEMNRRLQSSSKQWRRRRPWQLPVWTSMTFSAQPALPWGQLLEVGGPTGLFGTPHSCACASASNH